MDGAEAGSEAGGSHVAPEDGGGGGFGGDGPAEQPPHPVTTPAHAHSESELRPVERLAGSVLAAAGLLSGDGYDQGDLGASYLSRLERAAGVPPLPPLPPDDGLDGGDGDGGGLLTCTAPQRARDKKPASDVWNPLLPSPYSSSSSTPSTGAPPTTWSPLSASGTTGAAGAPVDGEGGGEEEGTTLEDLAPLSPDFYRAFGWLVCEACRPGQRADGDPPTAAANANASGGGAPRGGSDAAAAAAAAAANASAAVDPATYSLPRHDDCVWVLRIVSAAMEMNVAPPGGGDGGSAQPPPTFLGLLLRHCEGNGLHRSGGGAEAEAEAADGGGAPSSRRGAAPPLPTVATATSAASTAAASKAGVATKRARVPVLTCLFNGLSSLPTLEGYVRSLSRRVRYPPGAARTGMSVVADATVTAVTTTDASTPATSSSDRLRALQRWEAHKSRLESELEQHVATLERIIGNAYEECDPTLRGRCRTKLGGMLRTFALGGGGARVAAPAGAGVGGRGPVHNHHLLGVEDASASGIDAALRILLRILSGIDRAAPLKQSHVSLLFDVLIPLHRPSGMVLWRDQAPIVGLYHEPLVRCVGEILTRDLTLVGRVVGELMHPDIWPTEGGARGGGGGVAGGGGAVANTPKVVLLLHEVDTYLSLLDVAPPKEDKSTAVDGADGSCTAARDRDVGDDDEAQRRRRDRIASLSATILPLTVRLSACISSPNSRSSERALQFFRNAQFKALVWHYARVTYPVLVRALCRVDSGGAGAASGGLDGAMSAVGMSGMEVPWNPTVRKMTLLVLNELEGHDKKMFAEVCEELFGQAAKSGAVVGREGTGRLDSLELSESEHDDEKLGAISVSLAGKSGRTVVLGSTNGVGAVGQNLTSLRGAMGSWRPPASSTGTRGGRHLRGVAPGTDSSAMPPPPPRPEMSGQRGEGRQQPPLTVTGVAPWAMSGSAAGRRPGTSGAKQPPLTITGVAPWAMTSGSRARVSGIPPKVHSSPSLPPNKRRAGAGQPSSNLPSVSSLRERKDSAYEMNKTKAVEAMDDDDLRGELLALDEEGEDGGASNLDEGIEAEDAKENQSTEEGPGLRKVRRYMDELKPPKTPGEDSEDGVSSWARAQMAESPTLLPDLKFHDLVFGQTLGRGAFGEVKYARRIVRERTRSHWPEYAVKVVSTQKIEELGYSKSINREVATLRTLSHPGIARLISSFRFRDGAYLVLEYASGGDLHTLLKKNGSIDHESTQFVAGEIVAALWSIHEAGFVYGDLKPENILITETGHIKLTDFGGCRPVTDQAREMLKLSGKNILKELRDGDWREQPKLESIRDTDEFGDDAASTDELYGNGADDEDEEEEEDLRVEGTTAYLPPEVVVGGVPTTAADSWALGCLLYQCISGRPPHLDDTEDLTKQKIVTFELSSHGEEELFFGHRDVTAFQPTARNLIRCLLARSPHDRPGIMSVAEDAFFDGKDVFALHKNKAYPLDVGSVAPVPDAKWHRRQFSSIWAPQPQAYNIGSSDHNAGSGSSVEDRNALIIEGEESEMHFLTAHRPSVLNKISEM